MVVIVEGPDGTGKTTLARELVKRGFFYAHEGPTPAGVKALAYYGKKLSSLAASGCDYVLDRFHLGAYVYGPAVRGCVELTDDELTVFNRLLAVHQITLVIALPPWRLAHAAWKKNKENELIQAEKTLKKSYREFVTLGRRSPSRTWSYVDRGAPGLAAELSETGWAPRPPAGLVGSRTATTLVVGERSNGSLDLPFFEMERCSGFLNNALWCAGFKEADIAFVNALDRDGRTRPLENYLAFLKNVKKVILLGHVAARAFDEKIISGSSLTYVYRLNHPQHAKRFGGPRAIQDYVEKLKEVRS